MPPKKRQVMRKRPVRYDSDSDSDISEGDEFTTTRLADSERRGDVVVNKNPRYISEFSALEMMAEDAEKAERRMEQRRGGNVVRRRGRGDDSDDNSDDSTNNDYGAVRTRPYALRSRAARKPVVDYSSSSSSSSSSASSDDDESQSSLSDDGSSDSSSQSSLSDSDVDVDMEVPVASAAAAVAAPAAVVQEQEVVIAPVAQVAVDDEDEDEEDEEKEQQAVYQPTPAEEQEANEFALKNVAYYLGYKPDRAHLVRHDFHYASKLDDLKKMRLRQLQKAAERRAARGGAPSPPRKRPKPYVPTAEDKAKMDKLFDNFYNAVEQVRLHMDRKDAAAALHARHG